MQKDGRGGVCGSARAGRDGGGREWRAGIKFEREKDNKGEGQREGLQRGKKKIREPSLSSWVPSRCIFPFPIFER